MSTAFHRQVNMDRRPKDDWLLTVKLNSAITPDDVGKALSLDGTNANQFKLAADDDLVLARLEFVETDADGDSTGYGTVALSFLDALPIKTGETVVVGDSVVGAGAGEVKPADTTDLTDNYVVEVRGTSAIVRKA